MKRYLIYLLLALLGFASCDSKNDQTDNARGGKMFEESVSEDSLNAETTVDGEEQSTDTSYRKQKRENREYEREEKTGNPAGTNQ